jgi:hypothetical protein
MNPLKERKTVITTKTITTLLASVLVASFAGTMISMPQMIQSVNAQSSQGSEHACKELPGATLERGQCTAPAEETTTFTCAKVFGNTPTPTGDPKTCTTSTQKPAGTETNAAKAECESAGGTADVSGGNPKTIKCTYPATKTVTFDCPGDIEPIGDQCITKPGDRTEEEV